MAERIRSEEKREDVPTAERRGGAGPAMPPRGTVAGRTPAADAGNVGLGGPPDDNPEGGAARFVDEATPRGGSRGARADAERAKQERAKTEK